MRQDETAVEGREPSLERELEAHLRHVALYVGSVEGECQQVRSGVWQRRRIKDEPQCALSFQYSSMSALTSAWLRAIKSSFCIRRAEVR